MAQPYIGQILTFAGNFAPVGYLPCDGRSVSIAEYETLYTLIGTAYGGDGISSFNLPDLRGRTPVHMGQGQGLSNYVIGQLAGTESITLTTQQMPSHLHSANVVTGTRSIATNPAANEVLGDMGPADSLTTFTYLPYAPSGQTALAAVSISIAGGNSPHENRQPFLAIQYAIAYVGVFPSQS